MNPTTDPFQLFLHSTLEHIQHQLEACLTPLQSAPRLSEALRYSVLSPGKCLRPLLVYATGFSLGAPQTALDAAALAVELMHAYSLVHDDLPAMDNDDFRRGKPTCHKAFDEATAILVGDALQTLAFEHLSRPNERLNPRLQLKMLHCLSQACGAQGMAAGQMLDIEGEDTLLELPALEKIHQLKTGALITACIELGALAANAPTKHYDALILFSTHFGLAFQIQNDLLDVEDENQILGRATGSDQALQKSTYPRLLGLSAARQAFQQHSNAALNALHTIPECSTYLLPLTQHILNTSR